LSEHDAGNQRGYQSKGDTGQDLQEAPPPCREPGVQNEQRDDHRSDGDAVTRNVEEVLVGVDDHGKVVPRRLHDQGAQHEQECHGKCREGGNQRVADRFQTQPVPAARLDHGIGAVERDTQRLDTVRGEIEGEHGADGQRVGACGSQHVVDLSRNRGGNLLRPGLQHQRGGLIGKFL